MKKGGFTLIELLVAIALISILAAVALARFTELGTHAENANESGVVGSVRTALQIYRSNDLVTTGGGTGSYPSELDSNPDGSPCTSCFSELLDYGINDASWTRISATEYQFTNRTTTTTYIYNSAAGTFSEAP